MRVASNRHSLVREHRLDDAEGAVLMTALVTVAGRRRRFGRASAGAGSTEPPAPD